MLTRPKLRSRSRLCACEGKSLGTRKFSLLARLPDRDLRGVFFVVRLRTVGAHNHWHFLQFASFTPHDAQNNVESRLIHLGGRPRARTVIVTPWHGIEG